MGIQLSKENIQIVKEKTDIKKVKKKSDRKWFFRKGVTGDYIHYFNKRMLKNISKLEKNAGIVDQLFYFILFELRNIVKSGLIKLFNLR